MVSTNEVTTNDKSAHHKRRILFATTALISVVVALTIEPLRGSTCPGSTRWIWRRQFEAGIQQWCRLQSG